MARRLWAAAIFVGLMSCGVAAHGHDGVQAGSPPDRRTPVGLEASRTLPRIDVQALHLHRPELLQAIYMRQYGQFAAHESALRVYIAGMTEVFVNDEAGDPVCEAMTDMRAPLAVALGYLELTARPLDGLQQLFKDGEAVPVLTPALLWEMGRRDAVLLANARTLGGCGDTALGMIYDNAMVFVGQSLDH